MTDIKHVFFDLDHTLWDFEKNSELTFKQIFKEQNMDICYRNFAEVYGRINMKYWKLYRDNQISKEELRYKRLRETFDELEYDATDSLLYHISEDYIKYLPNYNNLFEGTIEILEYLKKKYELHIITNGFEEVQKLKMDNANISAYFDIIVTSESVGVKKPNLKVFQFAMEKAIAMAKECVMIGDSYEADVLGALNSGMHAIYFSCEIPENKNILRIDSLLDLKQYL